MAFFRFPLGYPNPILTHDVSTYRTPQTKPNLPPMKMRKKKRRNPALRTRLPTKTKKKKKTEKPDPAPQQKPT